MRALLWNLLPCKPRVLSCPPLTFNGQFAAMPWPTKSLTNWRRQYRPFTMHPATSQGAFGGQNCPCDGHVGIMWQ